MPNTKSAKKAFRSSERKHKFNLTAKYKIKNALKELRKGVAIEPANYQISLSKAYSAIDKAVKTKLMHKNTAARKKSRLVAMIRRNTIQTTS